MLLQKELSRHNLGSKFNYELYSSAFNYLPSLCINPYASSSIDSSTIFSSNIWTTPDWLDEGFRYFKYFLLHFEACLDQLQPAVNPNQPNCDYNSAQPHLSLARQSCCAVRVNSKNNLPNVKASDRVFFDYRKLRIFLSLPKERKLDPPPTPRARFLKLFPFARILKCSSHSRHT